MEILLTVVVIQTAVGYFSMWLLGWDFCLWFWLITFSCFLQSLTDSPKLEKYSCNPKICSYPQLPQSSTAFRNYYATQFTKDTKKVHNSYYQIQL